MRFGTCHFVTLRAARVYYAPYLGLDWYRSDSSKREKIAAYVAGKTNSGEIKIGPPPLRPGDSLSIIEGEGRYLITRPEN